MPVEIKTVRLEQQKKSAGWWLVFKVEGGSRCKNLHLACTQCSGLHAATLPRDVATVVPPCQKSLLGDRGDRKPMKGFMKPPKAIQVHPTPQL